MALINLLAPQRWNSDYAEWQAYYFFLFFTAITLGDKYQCTMIDLFQSESCKRITQP